MTANGGKAFDGDSADIGVTGRKKTNGAGPSVISNAADLDLEEFPDLLFIVSSWIVAGLTVFAGKPKMGKSWLALALGDSVSRGVLALGSLNVSGGDVLYLALEDTKRRLQQRLRAVRQGALASARLSYSTTWRRLDQGGLEDIERWIDQHPNAKLVVIDTMKQVKAKPIRDNTALYDQDYEAWAPLKALADRRNVAILVITHLRKATADDPLDEITGSTGITGCADTLMVLKREKGKADAILYIRGRDIEEQEHALQFDKATGLWSVLGDAAQYRQSQERLEIMSEIRQRGEPLSPKDVAEALGKNRVTIRRLMTKMADNGFLKRADKGRYILAVHSLS